jgi:cytidylate kinase
MKQILVIRGPSGTGKTTVSELLREKDDKTAIICPDTFYHEVFKNADRQIIYDSIAVLTDLYLSKGFSVIIEGLLSAFYVGGLDTKLKEIANEHKCKITKIYLQSNIDTLLKRNVARPHLRSDEQIEWFNDSVKSITNDEIVINVENLQPKDIIKKILAKV